MGTKLDKATHFVLALCANTGGDVVRLFEHYADHGKALAGLKEDGPYTLFWSLYAYYEDAPSQCLADFDTADEGLEYWSHITGLPRVGIPAVDGVLQYRLPCVDLSLVAQLGARGAAHAHLALCVALATSPDRAGDALAAYAPLAAVTIAKLELDPLSASRDWRRARLLQRFGYEFFYWLSQNIKGDKGRLPSEQEAQVLLDRLVFGFLNEEKGV